MVLGLGLKAERLGQASDGGVLQPSAVGQENGGRDGSVPRLLPGERNPVPREEGAQLGTGRVLGVPDDRGRHGRMLDPVLADAIHPSHQRLGDLGAQDLALTHQLQEVRPLQPEQAARLGGAEIGKDRGPQQQRQLAERIARAVGKDPLFAARDVLEDVDAALEYPVEARRLALGQE